MSILEIDAIQRAIKYGPHGEELDRIERWSRFRNGENREEWLKLLGPTAVVLSHQEYFTKFVSLWGSTIDASLFEPLILASSVHDMGEAKVGDIAAPDKIGQDADIEHAAALAAIRTLALPKELRIELQSAYSKVIAGDNQVLHTVFKAFERTEYLDTAIQLSNSLQKGFKMEKGPLMIARVLAYDLPVVADYARSFPNTIGVYLKEHQGILDGMFTRFESAVEPHFQNDFNNALDVWHQQRQAF